jgi:glycine cleavage system H protein
MNIPENLKYSKEHEWLEVKDDIVTIGITDYAQGELGDVVYVELPAVGDQFEMQDAFGTIEAVKAVSDLYCPISGEVTEINESLEDAPETVNKDPYGDGWMIKIRVEDSAQIDNLLDANAYKELIGE